MNMDGVAVKDKGINCKHKATTAVKAFMNTTPKVRIKVRINKDNIQYDTIRFDTMQCDAILHDTLLYDTMSYKNDMKW